MSAKRNLTEKNLKKVKIISNEYSSKYYLLTHTPWENGMDVLHTWIHDKHTILKPSFFLT